METIQKEQAEGAETGTEERIPIMAARKGGELSALDALMGAEEEAPDKDLKLRLVFKGTSLADVLKVFGAEVKDGTKQKSFVVPGAKGEKEVGDVIRLLFHRYAESGVTLADLVSLLNREEEK